MFHWLNGNSVVRSIGWKCKRSVGWPGGRVGASCRGPDWARAGSFCMGCSCGLHCDSECHWTMAPWHRARARGQHNNTNQKSTPQGSKGWGWIEKERKKDKKEKECQVWDERNDRQSTCWAAGDDFTGECADPGGTYHTHRKCVKRKPKRWISLSLPFLLIYLNLFLNVWKDIWAKRLSNKYYNNVFAFKMNVKLLKTFF